MGAADDRDPDRIDPGVQIGRRVWSLDRRVSFDLGTGGGPGRYRIVLRGSTPVVAAGRGLPTRPVVPRRREYREVNFHDCHSRLREDETTTDLSGRFVHRALLAMPATLRTRGRFARPGVPTRHRIVGPIAAPCRRGHDHHGPCHHGHARHGPCRRGHARHGPCRRGHDRLGHDHRGPCRHGLGPGRRRTVDQNEVHGGRRIRTRDPRGERRSGHRTDVPSAVPHRLRGTGDLVPRVGRIRLYLEMIRIRIRIQTVTANPRHGGQCLSGDHPSNGIHPMSRSGCRELRHRVLPVVGRSRAHLARRANPRFGGRILRRVRCSPTLADSAQTVHPTTRRGDLYDPRNLLRRLPLVGLIGMVAAA